MAQCPGPLLLLRIERAPLAATHAASIHQCRCPACAEPGEPLVRVTEADPYLGSQCSKGNALVNVSTYKSFPADGCQPGIRVGMHGV
jgi:hypothetical protein